MGRASGGSRGGSFSTAESGKKEEQSLRPFPRSVSSLHLLTSSSLLPQAAIAAQGRRTCPLVTPEEFCLA